MAREKPEQVSFLNALLGLILEPGYTTRVLIQNQGSPFSFTLVLILLLSIFVPIVAQVVRYKYTVYDPQAVVSIFVVLLFSILIFSVLEAIFLRILGISTNTQSVFACVAYSLTPFILAIWIMYCFNYFTSGSLTMVRALVTGSGTVNNDLFLKVLPLAFIIAQLNVLLVFFYSLKALGELYPTSALFVTAVSFAPLAISVIVSLVLGEVVRKGTIDMFERLIFDPRSFTSFQ